MNNTPLKLNKEGRMKFSSALITMICCCVLLTGFLPQALLSVIVVVLMVLLACTEELYLAYPIMVFYYNALGIVFGISVYRLYSLIFIVMTCIQKCRTLRLSFFEWLIFFIYAIYSAAIVTQYSIRLAVFDVVDVACALIMANTIRVSENTLKRFFTVYTAVAFCSFITGMVTGSSMGQQDVFGKEFVQYSRFLATFEDPNYMGFFFTLAVFAVVSLELFSPKTRIVVVIVLYAMILTALSITSVVVNILLWGIYIYARKQFNWKTVVIFTLMVAIVFGLYQYGVEHRSSLLGILSYRIDEKLGQLSEGDVSGAATHRLELSSGHLQYFESQPLIKQLFGGNLVTSSIILLDGQVSYSAHNEFVDELLNVGIIGMCILMGYAFGMCWNSLKKYRKHRKKIDMCIFMCKITWLIYVTSLTVFMDYKFMLPYFL